MSVKVSIVIPNWNGERFLARCLAATLQSAQSSGFEWELIVVDDASPERSAPRICQDFPAVRLLQNERNLGFGRTCNRGAGEASGEILVLLNNDLVPKQAMLGELVRPLVGEPGLFGVSAKTVEWGSEQPNHVNMAARWHDGGLELVHEDSPQAAPTMFLQGGACAVRRAEFLRLGGFCHLFSPGYWEDYDISYLALKAGWRNLYNPLALAHHLGQASMSKAFGQNALQVTRMRNYFYFLWLNLTDEELWHEHLTSLPRVIASGFAHGGGSRLRLRGLLRALGSLSAVRRQKLCRAGLLKCSDQEILARFQHHGACSRG